MTRFLLDSGIASDYLNHRSGVFERARTEVTKGHRIGIPGCWPAACRSAGRLAFALGSGFFFLAINHQACS
jgi:hypothetical protein